VSLYQQARRLARVRTYLIITVVVAGMLAALVGPYLDRLAGTCPEPPVYTADVTEETRAQVDALYDAGLLYCSNPEDVEGLGTVNGRVYWGSDGVSSVLYFPAESLAGVGVPRYGVGEDARSGAYNLGPPGSSPPLGYGEVRAGRTAWINQAPEGASYFYRFQGAPADVDNVATLDIKGPAADQAGVSGRDVFRDLEIAWDWVQRKPATEIGSTTKRIILPIVPERWFEVRKLSMEPELLDEEGFPSYSALRDLAPTEPMLYQVASGLLGTTVWVAGTSVDLTPSLVLVGPDGAPDVIEPIADGAWASDTTAVQLRHFAFEPLPAGGVYEVRYWSDAGARGTSEPDYTWTVVAP